MYEIKIKSIDTEKLEKDDSFPSAYAFYIILDREPDSMWRYIFNDNWKSALYLMKRMITIEGNMLRLITSDSDDVEGHVKFAKQLVEQTNEKYKEELASEEKRKKKEFERIEKTKNELREKLMRVKI